MTMEVEAEPGRQRPGIVARLANWWGPRPVLQLAVVVAVVSLFTVLGSNTAATMARIGISPGFSFLRSSANFEIGESMIAFSAGDTYARAIGAALLNTVKVALFGCILATVIGLMVAMARLSGNLLLSGLARWYVEIVRNTPLLLQLLFWLALTQAFPSPRQAISFFNSFFLTNRGVFIPGLIVDGFSVTSIILAATVLIAWGIALWRIWQSPRRGLGSAVGASAVAAVALALTAVFTGARIWLDTPALAGFNIRGGHSLTPEFAALLTGLSVKFSAAIAEIVRAGILSVSQGQGEAARALGLHNGQILRLVVLPQALRIITPLSTSSYLDLVKDSSLAVAIGYPDLVNIINTTANTTGQAFEALLILVGIYLAINLCVAAAMNIYNRRVALRGGASA